MLLVINCGPDPAPTEVNASFCWFNQEVEWSNKFRIDIHQRCKIKIIVIEKLSLYPFTVATDFTDTISGFFLKCLIIQIQKTIFYFQIKNKNYQTRNIKHTMIITPYFNLYLFTCLSFSCTTGHKSTPHAHPYLTPLFSVGPRLSKLCDPYDALQSFNVHTDIKR